MPNPRKTTQQEGGKHEHKQAQPRGTREEDCHQTDERREEQPQQGQSHGLLEVGKHWDILYNFYLLI